MRILSPAPQPGSVPILSPHAAIHKGENNSVPVIAHSQCCQWTDLEEPFCWFQFGHPTADHSIRSSTCICEATAAPVLGCPPDFQGKATPLCFWSLHISTFGQTSQGMISRSVHQLMR